MKYNLKNLLKKNYLFAGFLVFAYLIYIINNNNFHESFIIFIILILGYLLINFKIFYILLLLIIVSNLFLNFSKLIEGNSACKNIDKAIQTYIKDKKGKNILGKKIITKETKYSTGLNNDGKILGEKLQDEIEIDEKKKFTLSQDKIHEKTIYETDEETSNETDEEKKVDTSLCPRPIESSSEILTSDLRDISVECIKK